MKFIYIISIVLFLGCGRDNISSSNKNTNTQAEVESNQNITEVNSRGESIWNKCIGCHGAYGEKKALGKSDPIGGQDKVITISQLKDYRSGNLNQYGMGDLMKGQVAQLTNSDIEAVAKYIENL